MVHLGLLDPGQDRLGERRSCWEEVRFGGNWKASRIVLRRECIEAAPSSLIVLTPGQLSARQSC